MLAIKRYSQLALVALALISLGCEVEPDHSIPPQNNASYENQGYALARGVKSKEDYADDVSSESDSSVITPDVTEDDTTETDDTDEGEGGGEVIEPSVPGCPSLYAKCPDCIGTGGTCAIESDCEIGLDGVERCHGTDFTGDDFQAQIQGEADGETCKNCKIVTAAGWIQPDGKLRVQPHKKEYTDDELHNI
jgi:hypothetical protein